MHRLTKHKALLASLSLLIFLFSANAFSFGIHVAEEMLYAVQQAVNVSATSLEEARSVGSYHHHHHHHHDTTNDKSHNSSDSDCCDTCHNHDLADGPPLATAASTFSTLRFIEPFAWLPEIFLDLFTPPQNHA